MIILFYLSSGLFLGWSLGANDAANVFGTAVGSRMLRFKTTAIVASIFVILGAVLQGGGASQTLGKLGSVSTIAAAFTVALSAALTVYWMTRMRLPVSTSQAIVGAIIGWNLYTHNPTDISILTTIVMTWVSGPILGGLFAVLLFVLIKYIGRKSKTHILYRDSYIRFGLLIVGAFGAYSLGANNIANVMGVFVGAVNFPLIDLGFVQIDSTQQLFLIGGLAISVGIITYSRHVMETVGNSLMPLTSDAAIVVVLSQALVLFVFSSQWLSDSFQSIGLPAIPLVPVSSSQVVIGAIIGIGLYKGGKEIKYNILGSISLGWLATPIVACLMAFLMLFFVNNVFQKDVGGNNTFVESLDTAQNKSIKAVEYETLSENSELKTDSLFATNDSGQQINTEKTKPFYFDFVLIALLIGLIVLSVFLVIKTKKNRLLQQHLVDAENHFQNRIEGLEKNISAKIHYQDDMGKELKFRQNEMVTMAMSIIRKNEFLNQLKGEVVKIKTNVKEHETRLGLNKLSLMIAQDLSIDRDREKFQMHINKQNSDFIRRISENFPSMTDNEKRLASLLRLNLSSKEIASILNISPKSVEMNRYRLRKKLKVDPKVHLNDFIRGF
jgi:phosphate/sulfate permease/DNA-binding CsgD family transcriptional regulator